MNSQGIWSYTDSFPPVEEKFKKTLGEGMTSLIKTDGIYFKCEFENPTGSFKDRSICYQLAKVSQLGFKETVLSSSGNAAISAAYYCKLQGIKLTVFISPSINTNKLKILKSLDITVIMSKSPNKDSFIYARGKKIYNLRQSKDDHALVGYKTIAYELNKALPQITDIFIPCSSATSTVGIAEGFRDLGKTPSIHIVQTTKINNLARKFDHDFNQSKTSLSDAIVAKFTPRFNQVIETIVTTKGSGWVISDEEMSSAREWLVKNKINCSYEGAAALAAVWKAKKKGKEFKNPVCILSGKDYG